MKGSRTGWTPIGILAAASAAALLLAVGSASGQTITSKRAQAEAIVAEVESMNHELEATIEAWNGANVELDRIDTDLVSNAKHLTAASEESRHLAAAASRSASATSTSTARATRRSR